VTDYGTALERLGQLEEAVARSLDLLDAGRVGEAREELARQLPIAVAECAPSITDDEIEVAFARAESEREHMVDADSVARAAIHQVDRDLSREVGLTGVEAHAEIGGPPVSERFATATMAELLEQQGDLDGADRIRAGLDPSAPPVAGESPRPSRQNVVVTLESWLENLRRGART